MKLETHVANQVRALSDEELADLALKAGFSIHLKPRIKVAKSKRAIEPTKKPPAPKRRRPARSGATKNGKATGADLVLAFLQAGDYGVSISEVSAGCSMARSEAQEAVQELLKSKKAFKAGKARWTRYGDTKKKAETAAD